MGKNHISHRARDRLRQTHEFESPSFVPTISVERHIIIDSALAQEYQKTLHKNLGRNLRGSQKKRYHIVNPNELRLKLVENAPVHSQEAREVAQQLAAALLELLDRAPQWMALPLGRVACFNEANPRKAYFSKNVIGVEPSGWRGIDARYATYDERGLRTPIGLLAEESEVCNRILGNVVKTPYAAIVANAGNIPACELRDVQGAADASLPPKFEWQDVVVKLKTGPGVSEVEPFYVRAPDVYDLAA